ncbi:hypothetical protein DSM104299_02242 [Baekduia alba]|uniref:hypothetical protein n=1 Tax=Baekduia alba TaxID=2997333 RepID=UPI002341F7AD|nr:hypothetical protein [Baekduia alba]WCB93529.1 hypothetical protein DSM104299_02242 [Baekduia alba]
MRFRLAALVAVFSVLAVFIAACGGNNSSAKQSATDKASGLTVTVADDHVSLKRSAKSTSGTAGTSGTVSCTDDYSKLVKATAVPAPTQAWYATTLITWPGTSKESSATLSHGLDHDPQLCVVQSADSSASAIVYFDAKAKTGVAKLQTDSARTQQATQATAALQSAAQAAVGTVSKSAFPAPATLLQAITAQGLFAKTAAETADVKDAGTIYVVTGKTTNKTLTLAVKDSKGVVHTATQGVKGSPKVATVK